MRAASIGGWLACLCFPAFSFLGCSSEPDSVSDTSVTLHIPQEASFAKTNLRAALIADLASLPAPSATGKLLAAGKFEPDGMQLPGGLEVTWPLLESRTPGDKLWIVTLDRTRNEWLGTGERAVVAESGQSAVGRVWHFSEIGLTDQEPIEQEGSAAGNGGSSEDETRDPARIKAVPWRFTELHKGTQDLRDLTPQSVEEISKEISDKLIEAEKQRSHQPIIELFAKYPFEKVEAVAKSKTRPLTDAQSVQLAVLRRQMINAAMGQVALELSPDGRLVIGMLDSGNKSSGIASDVDQTLFIMPRELALRQQPPVSEALVMERFAEVFARMYEFPPARMGIESLNGADFFPDWRQKHTVAAFEEEVDRVVGEKRKSTEAYQSEGQLKSQAEGRGYDALQQHHRRVRDLWEARETLENIRANADLSETQRQTQIADEIARILGAYQKSYPAASLDELAEKFHRDSPWTEVRWNPSTGSLDASQLADPKNKVLAIDPERGVKRFAFDGAWDNWLMFEHHAHNRPKYLLRSVAEGVGLLRQQPAADRLTTYEAEKMYSALGPAELERFVNEVYRNKTQEVRDRYLRCLTVAAKDRLKHKGEVNPATKADYEPKEIWQHYWPLLEEKEARLFKEATKSRDALLLERARRSWEIDAREMMIENLLLTVMTPGEVLNGRITDAEVAHMRRVKVSFPDALPEKLTAAARKQLYHAFHDLMTFEYARHLLSPQGKFGLKPGTPDLVQRLLDRVESIDRTLAVEVRRIAQDAATKRISDEADRLLWGGTLQEVYDNRQAIYTLIRKQVHERLNSAGEQYRAARTRFESGEYTKELVGQRLLDSAVSRWNDLALHERLNTQRGALKARISNALGFRTVNVLIPEQGFQRVEFDFRRGNFDAKMFVQNLASTANIDSVMQVWLAYAEGGNEAALKQAGFEVITMVPGVMHAISFKELMVDGRPEGAAIIGTAMLVPGVGQAFVVWSIGKTSVLLLGHYVLDPLKDDDADKMYQGFLDERSGFKDVERSQRPSLLEFVQPRVVQLPQLNQQGDPVKDEQGNVQMDLVFAPYSQAEIVSTADKPAPAHALVFAEEFPELLRDGVLGGGEEWDRLRQKFSDDIANPVELFAVKRASLYYYVREKFSRELEQLLKPEGLAIDDPKASEKLVTFFLLRIKHWVDATGEFSDYAENTLISRRFEDQELRRRIAIRAAGDLVASYQIVKAIEGNIDREARRRRDEQVRLEANTAMLAIHDSYLAEPEPELVRAASQIVDYRRDDARRAAPRIHVRPTLIKVPANSAGGPQREIEKIRLLVSVVADPIEYPPVQVEEDSTEYKIRVRWERKQHGEGREELIAMVSVFGAQGQIGDTVRAPIGFSGAPFEMKLLPNRLAKVQNRDVYANQMVIEHPDFQEFVHPKTPQAYRLQVYASLSPQGPFDKVVGSVDLAAVANAPHVTPEMADQGWLSPEALRMNTPLGRDAVIQTDPVTKQIINDDHGAFYYQAAIFPVTASGERDKVRTGIVGPAKPEIYFNLPSIRDSKPGLFTAYGRSKAASLDGDLSIMQFGLGPGNQPFLYPGVRFKVTYGDQTRYVCSLPMRNRFPANWATGWAELSIPPQAEPLTKLAIQANWNGQLLTREYDLGFDEAAWKKIREELAAESAAHEQRWKTAVDRGDFKTAQPEYFRKRQLEYDYQRYRYVCDFRQMLPIRQALIQIKIAEFAPHLAALKDALVKRGGKPSTAPGSDPKAAESQHLFELLSDYGDVARLATYVGNAQVFRQTLEQNIFPTRSKVRDLLEGNLRNGQTEKIAEDHAWLANGYYFLTGDSEEAQRLYQQGVELATEQQRSKWEQQGEPAWMPAAKPTGNP